MKPFKQLLEEYTDKKMNEHFCSLEQESYPNEHQGFRAGSAASNELVLQLWEALEFYAGKETGYDMADEVLEDIRKKLEGTDEA